MTFTSNETAWMTTAVTLVYTSVQLWVVTKITTATDKEEAKEDIKNKAVLFLIIASDIYAFAMLFTELRGSGAVTRETLFRVVSSSFILFTSAFYLVARALLALSDLQESQFNYIDDVADSLQKLKISEPAVDNDKQ